MPHGFINDMLDVKLLILYITNRLLYPVDTQTLYELCLQDDKIVIETGEDQVRIELQKWSVMTNNTAEKEKSKRAAEAQEAAKKAKEEKKANKDVR